MRNFLSAIRLYAIGLLAAAGLVACEPDTTCYQDMATYMVLTMSGDSTGSDGTRYTYTAWDSLRVQGVGSDTVLYSNSSLKQLGLSLRPDTTTTAYLITYHGQTDTLWIAHTPRTHYVSLACGCAVYHTLTAARSTDPRIDSVVIINASVESTTQENLRIYLHE